MRGPHCKQCATKRGPPCKQGATIPTQPVLTFNFLFAIQTIGLFFAMSVVFFISFDLCVLFRLIFARAVELEGH